MEHSGSITEVEMNEKSVSVMTVLSCNTVITPDILIDDITLTNNKPGPMYRRQWEAVNSH